MTSKINLDKDWAWLMRTWLHLKQEAVNTGDKTHYVQFLKELQREFSKVYAGMKNEKWLDLMGSVLKTITCELKENIIKSNSKQKSMADGKKKPIAQMTDEELLDAYKKGVTWLKQKEQVAGTLENSLGETYNDDEWQAGLHRVEKLEAEMTKRGVAF